MSMLCPVCDAKLLCTDSRRQPTGLVKRSYRCDACGTKAYSVEVVTRVKQKRKDERADRAKARAALAAEVLVSQGIEV